MIACLLLAACSPPQDVQITEISVEADISAANVEPQRYLGEQPQHTVESDAYWMMQTEVTNA